MSRIPYANAIGKMMYVMVCNRLDISHVVSVVNKYIANYQKKKNKYIANPDKK